MTDSRLFYQNLKAVQSFVEATDYRRHVELPIDWHVVVADVLGSTAAIEAGRYKQVNTIGAAAIMAVINTDKETAIPYVFGGDGATLAVPPHMVEATKRALLGSQKLAREGFDLDLRIGIVPVSFLQSKDAHTRIVKFQLSQYLDGAAVSGRGWELAEKILKDPATRQQFEVETSETSLPDADFSGFECRWRNIPSFKDHKICLMVQALASNPENQLTTYQAFERKIDEIYGAASNRHPLNSSRLSLTTNPLRLWNEAKVTARSELLKTINHLVRAYITTLVGRVLMGWNIKTRNKDWGEMTGEVTENSDYQKFDGSRKMVFDGTREQQLAIEDYLEEEYQKDRLVYGVHTAPEALMTCLVFSYDKHHAHFVDASNGGYAMAARDFKTRLNGWLARQVSGPESSSDSAA